MAEFVAPIRGDSLMTHSGRMKNPLNEYYKVLKKLTDNRKKTDAHYLEISRIEWEGGLYLNDGVVAIPGACIDASLFNGAKKTKNGVNWKQGATVLEEFCPLKYKGKMIKLNGNKNGEIPNPMLDEFYPLHLDMRPEIVNKKAVLRSRPIFYDWSLTFTVLYDDEVFDERTIIEIIKKTGKYIGLCEKRPRIGGFELLGHEE